MMTVLLLDPQPRFLHRVSDEFGQTAQAYGQECRVVSVESSEAALKELGRQSLSHWDMFLVNQDYLQNGLPSPVVPSPLVEALRDRFAEIPVTILSVDRIAEADQTYKGLRMPLTGRPGYTTYVFPQSAFKAPNGNGGAAWPGVEVAETTCGDVFDIIRARKHVAAMLNHKGWLEELVSHGDIDVGISVVDCTYRLQYVNQQQRRISCRPDIQVGGICWMEYNPGFSQVHRCPWCPVAKARAARRARSSTTISPSVCPHAVAPGRQDLANLALP
ncbi:MAG: hypothetical protein NTW28_22805, partial [Candidatus Solibacter sp.]|nr:hypothetical protein [Candidatus Solibacter sp.]